MVSSNAFHAENAHNRFKMGPITKKNVVIPNPPSTSRHLHSSTVVNIVARTIICRHYWPTYAGPFVMNSREQISEAIWTTPRAGMGLSGHQDGGQKLLSDEE